MAPAVGSTEMRYFGISLFRRLASVTSALWPAVPTGGVPQRISCWARTAEVVVAIKTATAAVVRTRLSIAFLARLNASRRPDAARTIAQLGDLGKRRMPRFGPSYTA